MITSELFKEEINYIKNDTLRNIVVSTLNNAPECIQTIPASSSGKYHPFADLGVGGLVRHTKAVVGVANCLIGCDIFRELVFGVDTYPNKEAINMYADIAYASLILHDCYKAKDEDEKHKTLFDHPLLASELFIRISKQYLLTEVPFAEDVEYMKKVIPLIKGCIASHMGEWNSAVYAKGIVLPKPSSGIEVFCHMCDYIASRKYIDFNFEKYYGDK